MVNAIACTIDYQQIENSNIANQIHGFTIHFNSKFILKLNSTRYGVYHYFVNYVRKIKLSKMETNDQDQGQ